MRFPRRIQSTPVVLWVALALGVSARRVAAQDDADEDAKFNAKAALISARVIYLTSLSYGGVTSAVLSEKNPGLRFLEDAPSTGPAALSVKILGSKEFRIAVYGSKTCWGIREEGRQTGVATLYARRSGPANDCRASSFRDRDFVDQERIWKD
jgi:hypothetical protein